MTRRRDQAFPVREDPPWTADLDLSPTEWVKLVIGSVIGFLAMVAVVFVIVIVGGAS